MCRTARPSVRTLLPDLPGTLMPHFISDLPGPQTLRLAGKPPHRVRKAFVLYSASLNPFFPLCITVIDKFIPFSTLLSVGSSSSSSPSELSEGPASDGSSLVSATGGSNQHDDPGLSAAAAAAPVAAAAASQSSTGHKSGPASSVPVATPAPRITPINNGPLPQGYRIIAAKPPRSECDSKSYLLL